MITHTLANGAILTINADFAAVMPSLAAASVDMIFADFPYGTTNCKWDTPIDLALFWREAKHVRRSNAVTVCTAAMPFTITLGASNLPELVYSWVWEKHQGTNPMIAKYQPMRVHEDILIFYSGTALYNPQMTNGEPYAAANYEDYEKPGVYNPKGSIKYANAGTRYPRSIQQFRAMSGRANSSIKKIHATQKPLDLIEYFIRTYTNAGDLILDPTAGSGSTAIAAYKLGRRAIVIEKDPAIYADMLGHIGANI